MTRKRIFTGFKLSKLGSGYLFLAFSWFLLLMDAILSMVFPNAHPFSWQHIIEITGFLGISACIFFFLLGRSTRLYHDLRNTLGEADQFNFEIVSSAGEGIVVYDSELRYIFWNPFMESLTGMPASKVLGQKALDLFPHLSEYGIDKLFEQALRGKTVYSPDIPYQVPRTGKSGWVSAIYVPHRDARGKITGVVAHIRDITERKRSEERMQAISERFWVAFNFAPNPAAITDMKSGEMIEANKAFLDWSGYRREELIGRTTVDLGIWPDSEERNGIIQVLKTGKSIIKRGIRLKNKKGEPSLFLFSACMMRLEGQPYIFSTAENITEIKKIEEALRQSEEKYRRIVETSLEGIWVMDRDSKTMYMNRRLEELLGYSWDEMKGRIVTDFMPEEELPDHQRIMNERKEGKSGFYERRFRRKDGTRIHCLVSASALLDSGNNFDGSFAMLTDITDRKKAERDLREREEQLRTISNNLPASMIYQIVRSCDGTRRFTYLSNTVKFFYGITPEEGMRNPELIYDRVHEEDRRRVFEEEEAAYRNFSVFKTEARIIDPSGKIRWSYFASSPRRLADGTTGWDGVEIDITDRKRAEEVLSESEERFRQMFDHMSNCVAVYEAAENGEDFIFKDFNASAEKSDRIKREEVIGKSVLKVFPGVRNFGLFEVFQRVWRSGVPENLPIQFYKDNRVSGWRENYVYKLPNGDIVSIYDDVTAKKRAEEERDLFFSLSLDMIAIAGFDGFFKQLNPAWEKVLGWRTEELLAKPYLEFVHPEDRPATIRAGEKLAAGGTVFDFQNRYRCRDGSFKWISWNTYPLAEEQLIVASARDITERKQLEQAMRDLNRKLERGVALRTAQLEDAVKELEAFTYSVSHDLRSPLRAINGFANALLEDFGPKLEPEAQRFLNLISSNASNMGKLIDDLLALSRIGRHEISRTTVDMRKLVETVIKEVEKESPGRVFEWVVGDLPPCVGDPGLIQQVWANLLSNAAKFTRVSEQAKIEIGAQSENEMNVYFVKDNGVGFDMQYSSKLFKVFQRLHGPSEFEGSGVGLAIVHRIVYRHGGKTWGEGSVGGGAVFYFSIPGKGEGG
ncbi:MAG TPA: PAS domain S-box protein [Candidatus Omnitrophota bacterium]|nr:PAS domain S-box protein [Candidatus Omnitrophota bacterium]